MSALRGSPVTISTQDLDLRYTWISNAVGFADGDAIGRTDAELWEDTKSAQELTWLKKWVIESGVPQRRQRTLSVRGKPHHFDLAIAPIQGAQGELVGVTCTATDITHRHVAEQATRESEARFRAVQEASPDAFMICRTVRDTKGAVYDFEWVYVNPAAEVLLGRSAEEIEGARVLREKPAFAASGLFEACSTVVESGETFQCERRYRNDLLDGTFRVVALPLGDGFALSLHDLSDRTRAENERARLFVEEQRARKQAERMSKLKDEFLASVSHELRTPLQAILGWARLLRKGDADMPTLVRALESIERNAEAQARLVEDVLDASAIMDETVRLRREVVVVADLVEGALERVRPAAFAKNVAIITHFADGVATVTGDPARLRQVVSNLASNAVKFTPRGGHVTIAATTRGSDLQLVFDDDGEGISAEFLPFVFDTFRQAEGGSTRRYGGLGLGLAVVRHYVEAHGGTVTAASPGPGKGSTFRVSLPLVAATPALVARSEPSVLAKSEASRAVLEGIRVLLVDDEPDARDLLHHALGRFGARVSAAGSVAEAMGEIDRNEFDVIVSDIGMPSEDGYSLLRRVRSLGEHVPTSATPALALTAYARGEDRRRALASGFQMHLAKPIDPTVLVAAVAELAGRGTSQ